MVPEVVIETVAVPVTEPAAVVTSTLPLFAAVGTVNVSLTVDTVLNFGTLRSNLTDFTFVKFFPVTVIVVPTFAPSGEILVIEGFVTAPSDEAATAAAIATPTTVASKRFLLRLTLASFDLGDR